MLNGVKHLSFVALSDSEGSQRFFANAQNDNANAQNDNADVV